MRLLLFLVRSSWPTVLAAALVGAVSGVSSVALIAIIHRTLRDPHGSTGLLVVLFATFCVTVLATQVISQILLTRLAQNTMSRIRMGLSRQILRSYLRKLEEIGEHRLLAALTGDVPVISMAANGVPVLCVNAMVLICGGLYLGWLSPALLVCAIAVCAIGVSSYLYSSRFARRYIKQGREAQDGLLKHLRALILGVKELQLHHARRQEFVERSLAEADAAVRENQFVGFCLQGAAVSWGRLILFLAIGLLLFAWPRFSSTDGATLTGYTLTILYLMSPLERIVAWLPLVDRAGVSIGKIRRLGLTLEASETATATIADKRSWDRIELRGVTQTYQREQETHDFLLGPIDLALRPGEIVFIVGGNGCGKTTLAKLLCGLYAPEQGEIRWNGQAVEEDNRETYRQLFSAIFDNAVVFESLLGMKEAGIDTRAADYLRQLELDRAVEVVDGVFSTTALSRGQRKRLALVTAYLEDRPIYLFDEWAADQDPEFKRLYYERFLPELKSRGKTVLAITHDDRYFSAADRLIKLEDGRIARDSRPAVLQGVGSDRSS